MSRTLRFFAALAASCCSLLAFASLSSAQQILYGANGGSANPSTNLFLLDPSSGAVLQTGGPIGFPVTGLALDPSTGTLYGVTANDAPTDAHHLITINTTTAAGTDVGDLTRQVGDITFTPDGTLFGWTKQSGFGALVTIDKASGASTVVGPSGLPCCTFGSGLASNAAGTIFLAGFGDNGELDTVDRSTGAATMVATLDGSAGDPIGALAFDAAGTLFGARQSFNFCCPRPADLLTIDAASGAISSRGPSVDALDAIAFAPKPARSVNLQKKKLQKGKKVRLSGHVDSPTALRTLVLPAAQVPGDHSACDVGQTVELQRKTPKAKSFGAFRLLTTDNAGNFSTKVKVKKTFQYRAFLSETPLCEKATSNIQNVKKLKKKK
jgi:hypothetical protein